MRAAEIIDKKKRGYALEDDEIRYIVNGAVSGDIPDYQLSALLMAIYFSGMKSEETAALTLYMAKSGDELDLSRFGNLTADKHSSGGIGDKTTLIAAPIAAAAGCVVAKMSGRGLGYTGGTVDKLESVPGLSVSMTTKEFYERAQKHGIVLAGQSENLAPCDKKLYALRDVTATVDCMPLIASSIMSKKLAAGAKNIVLDVKYGSGAFMSDKKSAEALADEMIFIGKRAGRNMSAVITDMNTPLGYAVGNLLEVTEAVKVLKGEDIKDLKALSLELSSEMIRLSLGIDKKSAYKKATDLLSSGRAYEKFLEVVASQGGDVKFIENIENAEKAKYHLDIKAEKTGILKKIDALQIGKASVISGAGRNVITDSIDPLAGVLLKHRENCEVTEGDTVLTVYSSSLQKAEAAQKIAEKAVFIE